MDRTELIKDVKRLKELAHKLNDELYQANNTIINEFSGDLDNDEAENKKIYEETKKEIENET
ncbi:hypothetical protein [Alkalihalophilus marmarensis]|uniref:hypothetical protein n=1 Tax=Alkalihalophilus marmarensis TaxID=521377 RepID=UPI002E1ADA47|nr:hypothetical protein [Alkalihalophilus marmarensis]